MSKRLPAAVLERVTSRSVANCVDLPQDVATEAAFLVSDAAVAITSAVLGVGTRPGSVPGT